MRSSSRDSRTQPVPSMSAWADGSASTANTASGAASIVVDALTRSLSISVRRLAGPELIAARSATPGAQDDVGDVWGAGRWVDAPLDRVQLDREVVEQT